MKKTKKILTVFAIFLYFISFAYAQDFALFSGKFYGLKDGKQKIEFEFYNGTYSICESEERTIPILVVKQLMSMLLLTVMALIRIMFSQLILTLPPVIPYQPMSR